MKPRLPSFLEVARGVLESGYGVQLHTRGGSMTPLIRGGCLLQVEQVDLKALRFGDIIVYRTGETLVAHRLIGRKGHGRNLRLLTRGDANFRRCREEVKPAQVLGRVSAVNWRRGVRLRIDSGVGRMLSLALAAAWPIPQGLFLLLSRLKAGWDCIVQSNAGPRT